MFHVYTHKSGLKRVAPSLKRTLRKLKLELSASCELRPCLDEMPVRIDVFTAPINYVAVSLLPWPSEDHRGRGSLLLPGD